MGIESFSVAENKEEKPFSPEVAKSFEEVSTIAQIVGGDFGMKVKIGVAGRGSYYHPEEVSITIDPEHLEKNKDEVKFIIAHEGGHRAITRSPLQLGVSREKVQELYSKPGFAFIQNAIEDPADNDWVSHKFVGLKDYVKDFYDDQFTGNEDIILSTPDVMDYVQKLGFMPKFAKFGSEIIRHWHQGRYSSKIEQDVLQALQKTEKSVKKSIATIPTNNLVEAEVIEKSQKRFQINTEEVWPQVEKLLESDLKNANRSEALQEIKDVLKNSGKNGQKFKSKKEAGKKDESSQDSGESQAGDSDQSGGMFQKLKQLGFTGNDIQKIEQTKQQVEELQKSKNKKSEKSMSKNKEAGLSKEESDMLQNKDEQSLLDTKEEVLRELSEKLDKYLESLSPEEREALEKKARSKMEDFEDVLNKKLESKLNSEKPKNHQEVRHEINSIKNKQKQQEDLTEQKKEQQEKLDKMRESLMSDYEKYRSEMSGEIDSLYFRLKRVLRPDDFGKEESGYSSGQRPDMIRVMQSDYDFNQKTKLWIREQEPEHKDYRFMNLIDMSSSMEGEPIKQVFKGFLVVGEAIDHLEDYNSEKIKIRQAIKGFHDKVFHYKGFNTRFTEELEKKLGKIVDNTDGSTDTYKGTKAALEEIEQNAGKTGNFVLTFTDGSPNYDSGEKLQKLLKDGREERRKKKIRMGLVWLNDATDSDLKQMINKYGYDFGLVLETKGNKKEKTFSQKLGDVIEDIIENPQKY